MTVEAGRELETRNDNEPGDEARHQSEDTAIEPEAGEVKARRSRLPWIGGLPNPNLGPMVVLNDGGYLVPVCTAGDLLRGCKYYWHRSQE